MVGVLESVPFPVSAFVGLGANLGDPVCAVRHAVAELARIAVTRVERVSSLYRTTPVDAAGPDFINAVAEVRTALPALDLLAALHEIEHRSHRVRTYRNAPRTLDLDLLLYADTALALPGLVVPHPRMWERAFVLIPLAEIAPEKVSNSLMEAVASQAVCRVGSAESVSTPEAG
ncbi:2-amino-4-hydroxy-6-hydroxymethyldihydropteridine diphosphokinase [Candidatus Symbiobacter mobilis]|uniref:2-amino-4-hydroxy-6- hydroxymethyldihydropteridine diphosphokinase n=1 Tax=Candidatus Symbiobacter mobilis TaxID=1436290 RepID=UPI000688F226|nr:2-amino-4-hydroxy-6-hydroxymethyldihydropteridine diphosphokinase [Candidatus Symbiobacter mobilis]